MTVNPNAGRDRLTWRHFRESAEGGLSLESQDSGNYYRGALVGSKYGVTGNVLALWLKRPVTAHDVAALTTDTADQIADKFWWLPLGGDLLPSGINLMLIDFAWGDEFPNRDKSARAVPMLQELLGFTGRDVDGIVGPITLLACKGTAGADLINKLYDAQCAFYKVLGEPEYVDGWIDRAGRRRDTAKTLAVI